MRFKINKGLQILANRRIENHLPLARVVRQELPLKEGQEKILLGIEAFSKLNKLSIYLFLGLPSCIDRIDVELPRVEVEQIDDDMLSFPVEGPQG